MFRLIKKYKTSIIAALAEIAIVFIGISISLYIDDWKEEKDNRVLEEVYLRELYSELTDDFLVLQNLKNEIDRRENLWNFLLDYMHHPDSIEMDQLTFKRSIGRSFRLQNFVSKDYTFKDLTSTGNMKLISDAKLRKLIYRYYNYVAQAEQTVGANNNIISDLFNTQVFPNFNFRELMDYNWMIDDDKLTHLNLDFIKDPNSKKFVVLENLLLLRISLNYIEIDFYKNGFSSCADLRNLIGDKLGIPNDRDFLNEFKNSKKSASELFHDYKSLYPDFLLVEMAVNAFGYQFLEENKKNKAIELFLLNVEMYPHSPNVYDSLGDGYLAVGNKDSARVYFKKAYEMNPSLTETKQKLSSLEKLNDK